MGGLSTGTPSSSARAPTGEATRRRPRPAGASGRVTTPTRSWPLSATARSDGRATSGVPANTTLTRELRPSGRESPERVRAHLDRRDEDAARRLVRLLAAARDPAGGAGAEPLRLADRPHRALAGLRVEPLDEEHPVEVVGLVLDRAGQQVGPLHHERLSVHVEAAGDDLTGSTAVEREVRDREAALLTVLGLLRQREVGV